MEIEFHGRGFVPTVFLQVELRLRRRFVDVYKHVQI